MGGGDKVTTHNEARNAIHGQAGSAGTRPELEKSCLLADLGWPNLGGRGPADTLLCSTAGINTGKKRTWPRVALDVGIVCPQARSHLESAAREVLGAAHEYVGIKCRRNDTEVKCEEGGINYQPIIFESLGGAAGETERVLNCLSWLVADNTNTPRGEVAQQLWQRISIDLQRISRYVGHN